ncbi:MAG: pyridoxal phosphate-dependent aminotransferase [Fimbriimonadaceae bacterium]
MPQASSRAQKLPPSPIRKLAPYADAAKARGVKVHHLNIGQPDIETPAEFWEAVHAAHTEVLEYAPSMGLPELRETVARHYSQISPGITSKEVLVCTAGSEAIHFAFLCGMEIGDEVIIPEPMYANYIGFAAGTDVRIRPITTHIEQDFGLPDIKEFKKKINAQTKAILICNPSNPTGTVFDEEQLMELRDLCLEYNLFLISDEVYRDFCYLDTPPPSVLQLPGMADHTIVIDSVSKRFSLCGARVGFLVTRNQVLMDAANRAAMARLSSPTIEQLGVLGAYKVGPEYFSGIREVYRERRDLLVSRLKEMPGVTCPEIRGAFYAMVQLPIDDADRFAQWLLEEFDHKGETVMIAPGTGFYVTPGLGKDECRIAYVLDIDRLNRAMDCLAAALVAYPGKTN